MSANVYIVHESEDPNSPVIATGLRKDICHELDIGEYYFYKMNKENSNYLADMYYVEKFFYNNKEQALRKAKELKSDEKKEKKKSAFEEKIESVERHLNFYGNTIIYKNYKRIIKRLEKDGYFVSTLHEPERIIKYTNISGEGDRDIYPECWIITLVKKENKE